MSGAAVKKASSLYWRLAGLTYLVSFRVSSFPRGCLPPRSLAAAFAPPAGGRRAAPRSARCNGSALSTLPCGASFSTFFAARSKYHFPLRTPRSRFSQDALNASTSALRSVLKEPARSEALGKSGYRFREFGYEGGKELPPGACRGARPRRREGEAAGAGAGGELGRRIRARSARARETRPPARARFGECLRFSVLGDGGGGSFRAR